VSTKNGQKLECLAIISDKTGLYPVGYENLSIVSGGWLCVIDNTRLRQ